jgi:hypothetical protein
VTVGHLRWFTYLKAPNLRGAPLNQKHKLPLLQELKTKQLGLLKREETELKLIEMRGYLLSKLTEKGMENKGAMTPVKSKSPSQKHGCLAEI